MKNFTKILSVGTTLVSLIATPAFASNGEHMEGRMMKKEVRIDQRMDRQENRWERFLKRPHVTDACHEVARATHAVSAAQIAQTEATAIQVAAQQFLTSAKASTDVAVVTAARKTFRTATMAAHKTANDARKVELKKMNEALRACNAATTTTTSTTGTSN